MQWKSGTIKFLHSGNRTTMKSLHRWLSLSLILLGALLMTYMIRVESEPGLIPLVMLGTGLIWFLIAVRNPCSK